MQDPNPNPNHGERLEAEPGLSADAEQSRREFLKKAGRFAAYTPPAIMLLMQPSRDAIAHSGGGVRQDRSPDRLQDHVRHHREHPNHELDAHREHINHEMDARLQELRDLIASRRNR